MLIYGEIILLVKFSKESYLMRLCAISQGKLIFPKGSCQKHLEGGGSNVFKGGTDQF